MLLESSQRHWTPIQPSLPSEYVSCQPTCKDLCKNKLGLGPKKSSANVLIGERIHGFARSNSHILWGCSSSECF
jgi:hypothetical protein